MDGAVADTRVDHGPAPHERILTAARELFCRDGIANTGIDRVLAQANASKMTLYSRFGSKENLLREVLLIEGAEWRASFESAVASAAPDPEGRLRAIIPALAAWFDSGRFYGCAFMNAAAERTKLQTPDDDWLRRLTRDHHRAIRADLARHAAEAGFAEPEAAARRILLVIDGTIAALMVTRDPAVLDAARETLDAVLADCARTKLPQ